MNVYLLGWPSHNLLSFSECLPETVREGRMEGE